MQSWWQKSRNILIFMEINNHMHILRAIRIYSDIFLPLISFKKICRILVGLLDSHLPCICKWNHCLYSMYYSVLCSQDSSCVLLLMKPSEKMNIPGWEDKRNRNKNRCGWNLRTGTWHPYWKVLHIGDDTQSITVASQICTVYPNLKFFFFFCFLIHNTIHRELNNEIETHPN